jgi:flagellar basal-body rod protein FlgG
LYVALSGMRTRMAQLEHAAADIANEGTAGYKGERATTVAVNRPSFGDALDAAVDAAPAQSRIDFRPGVILGTGRDLDVAVDGPGFFSVQTAAGTRYTRNGHFSRSADGTLVTGDGMPVLGQNGPIKLGDGEVGVNADGTISVDKAPVDKLQLVDFPDYSSLSREEYGRFRIASGVQPVEKPPGLVRGGALEQSNVSLSQQMANLTATSRGFEALQKGVSLLANDIDSRAISELGRR